MMVVKLSQTLLFWDVRNAVITMKLRHNAGNTINAVSLITGTKTFQAFPFISNLQPCFSEDNSHPTDQTDNKFSFLL